MLAELAVLTTNDTTTALPIPQPQPPDTLWIISQHEFDWKTTRSKDWTEERSFEVCSKLPVAAHLCESLAEIAAINLTVKWLQDPQNNIKDVLGPFMWREVTNDLIVKDPAAVLDLYIDDPNELPANKLISYLDDEQLAGLACKVWQDLFTITSVPLCPTST